MIKRTLVLNLLIGSMFFTASAGDFNASYTSAGGNSENGKNIISIEPFSLLNLGLGPGVSYEWMLKDDGSLSLILPLSLMMRDNSEYSYVFNNSNNAHYLLYLHFTPGVKFYPTKHRFVNYAVGPNLLFAYGGGSGVPMDYYAHPDRALTAIYPTRERLFSFGLLVNNYLSFQFTPKIDFTITGGLGICYLEREKITESNPGIPVAERTKVYSYPIRMTGQISLGFGYRF